jgi:uncharacterized protein (TIGR02466 family)
MVITIEQVLQEAIEAHKVGRLQDAEAGYRTFLQIQPKHPDASHNLGLLAVAMNKLDVALPLFKTALETNPNQGQFWISYVDALVKNKQFNDAKNVLEQGKKLGLTGEKVDSFIYQLASITVASKTEPPNAKQNRKLIPKNNKISEGKGTKIKLSANQRSLSQLKNPSQPEVSDLLEHYQHKRYNAAEELAKSIIHRIPTHQLSWKVLAATLKQTGRLEEALIACQKAVELVPKDAEAHSNLGNALQVLGMLEEAEASYIKTLALKPDLAEAHYNLGNTLQELGRLEDAERSYSKAIKFKPSLALAHCNLGNILRKLGRLEEAETNYRKAIRLKPDLAEAHSNLGVTLKDLGKLEEAETSFGKALEFELTYAPALLNRGKLYFEQQKFELALKDFDLCGTQAARARSLEALYALGRIDEIYQRIETLSQQDKKDIRVAAFASFVFDRQKKELANNFCKNPLDFLYLSNLSIHLEDPALFIAEVIQDLHKIKPVWEPLGKSTHKGFQSRNNLFQNQLEKINDLKVIIENEIDSFYLKFKNEPCLFMQDWPIKKNLHGWYVILKQQGYQSVHIHPSGWLSGVIYLKVVPSLEKNEGAIEFGLNGEHFFHADSPKIIYQPKIGDIVFFPSSLHHKTLPFLSDAERIIISFDLLPKLK